MKYFLNENKIYVVNNDSFIYEINEYTICQYSNSITYELKLVGGYDYVDPDNNDNQRYVTADNFIEEVQYDTITQYFLIDNGIGEAIQDNGYKIIKKLPKIIKLG